MPAVSRVCTVPATPISRAGPGRSTLSVWQRLPNMSVQGVSVPGAEIRQSSTVCPGPDCGVRRRYCVLRRGGTS